MKKRVIKLMICVMLISCLLIGFSTVSYAALPNRSVMQRFNAWVASAMVAANITIGSTVAPVQQVLDAISYGANMPWTPQYTYQGPTWDDDIMDRSVIHINPDYVVIDGVPYTDVWLSHDASQKFRVNAFDVESAWNIASESNGTFASGIGTFNGIPIYRVNNRSVSQLYMLSDGTNGIGNFVVDLSTSFHDDYAFASVSIDGGTTVDRGIPENQYIGIGAQVSNPASDTGGNFVVGFRFANTVSPVITQSPIYYLNRTPFEFDWTSGVVPAEQLDPDYGLHFLVPSSHSDSTHEYDYDFHDLVTVNPDIVDPNGYQFNFDPSLNPDFQLDLDTNDALGAIISAVIAAYLADLLDGDGVKIEYNRYDEPAPDPGVIDPLPDPDPAPVDPVPGTTIADTDWTKLDEILRWIQSTIDSIRHLTESLQTMLDNIIQGMRDILEQISEIPESIRELADKILEDIELGPAKLFDKALDILKTLFLPLLLPIRAMMNLWHYVVEWIHSITTPFTWIFGIMSGTSGNMVLPIYALLAGGICISIYKALGR